MKSSILALILIPLAVAAPLLGPRKDHIADQWIVVLKPDRGEHDLAQSKLQAASCAHIEHQYNMGSFKGFSMSAPEDCARSLAESPDVAYIQPDSLLSIQSMKRDKTNLYGLHRISHADRSNPNTTTLEYVYDDSAGKDTWAYVINTGIQVDHPEFEGRATWLANYVPDEAAEDLHGHGTHVAGTIGSKTHGVAKKTNLIAVKILDRYGGAQVSWMIAGIDSAVSDAERKNRVGKSVINLSLGAPRQEGHDALMDATANAVKHGLFLAVAAGNTPIDARHISPAAEPTVCTVGAVDEQDRWAYFSSYGEVVDVAAPGVGILSTAIGNKTETRSGTSMAAPHVAGLGAYLLGLKGANGTFELCERIQKLSNKEHIADLPPDTKNFIAYNNAGSSK
ncbi:alkaline serine protease [Xylariales sp. AK1849]|nr:alkaline serine protease [Xylariales sp. AK1849]